MKKDFFKKVNAAVRSIRKKTKARPRIGIILGSGLGKFIEQCEGVKVPYPEIRGIPCSCIHGQKGILFIGDDFLIFGGRFHYYEGYSLSDVVLPVFLSHKLGISRLIVTNAAGGINPEYKPGELVLIKDHINLLGNNPLRGPYEEEQGMQFPDMTNAYTKNLREIAKKIFPYKEGVYAALPGPNYETPAEVRMLKAIGADMVGMSTVPEVIAAASLSMEVLGISCIVNKAAGLAEHKLTHDEVVKAGEKTGVFLSTFLFSFLEQTGYTV